MKQKSVLIYVAACVVIGIILALVRLQMSKDTPPEFSLNGTELDLSSVKVSDLNEAGFWLPNNDGTMPGSSFKERLSYYHGEDRTVSKTTFYFDTKTKECYEVEIDRKESNLVR